MGVDDDEVEVVEQELGMGFSEIGRGELEEFDEAKDQMSFSHFL